MRRILFVDDEVNVLQGFKRLLRPMRYEWCMEFASSGEEALDFISKASFDAVISDMRMPKMDGVELLSIIMEQYPEIVRIMLSGHSDREMILKTVKCTHQFLAKPCDAESVKYTIERACKLQDLLRDETLKRLVSGIENLPSLPILYSEIVKEIQSPNASLKKVGSIISQDASMSAKVLKLVNSAYFGLPQKITDVQQAAVYLGIETLKALVLSIHVFSSFTEYAQIFEFSLSDMWKHNLMVSKLAREIASIQIAEKKVVEEALVAGILHDIGGLIMLRLPDQYKEVKYFIDKTGSDFVEAEYAVMKTSHAELGACLLGLWGIPDNVVETVAFHHNPSKLLENIFIKLNKSSNKDEVGTESNDSVLKVLSAKKYLTEFTALTSVHVANALMKQKNVSFETTDFPYLDMLYLRTLNLTDKLPEWIECYNKVMEEGI